MTLNGDIFGQVQKLLGSVSTQEAEAHITRLTEEIDEKKDEQQRWYSLLALKSQLGEVVTVTAPEQIPLKRAIRLVLEERGIGATIALSVLRDELQRRNWLGTEDTEYHRLQMAASNMAKRGELDRPRKGLYRLASSNGSVGESLSEAPSSASGAHGRHSSRTGDPGVGGSSSDSDAQTRIPQPTI
jgi:hypothetical protein